MATKAFLRWTGISLKGMGTLFSTKSSREEGAVVRVEPGGRPGAVCGELLDVGYIEVVEEAVGEGNARQPSGRKKMMMASLIILDMRMLIIYHYPSCRQKSQSHRRPRPHLHGQVRPGPVARLRHRRRDRQRRLDAGVPRLRHRQREAGCRLGTACPTT